MLLDLYHKDKAFSTIPTLSYICWGMYDLITLLTIIKNTYKSRKKAMLKLKVWVKFSRLSWQDKIYKTNFAPVNLLCCDQVQLQQPGWNHSMKRWKEVIVRSVNTILNP